MSSIERLEKLRATFRKDFSALAGADGEKHAERWFQTLGWKYDKIPQDKLNQISEELRNAGGKRPDFIAITDDIDEQLLLFDAKYHKTNNCTTFKLKDSELEQYRALVRFTEQFAPEQKIHMMFVVIPKECDGNRLALVHLDEFKNGVATNFGKNPATEVSININDNEMRWYDNIPK